MKRSIMMALCIMLCAGLAISGTMAYLQDTASNVNVMTLGSVKIALHEYERIEKDDGSYEMITTDSGTGYKLQEFTQGKPLLPAVGEATNYGTAAYADQLGKAAGGQKVLEGLENVVDKFVAIENTGKSDAYVRAFIAFEQGSMDDARHNDVVAANVNSTYWTMKEAGKINVDGNNYYVLEFIYQDSRLTGEPGVLPKDAFTSFPLAQVYLDPIATNEDMEAIDGNGNGVFDIMVLAQAVQTKGFEAVKDAEGNITKSAAEVALEAGFPYGDDKEATIEGWFGGVALNVATVYSAEELQEALDSANEDITILLGADITGNVTVHQREGVNIIIDGVNHEYTGTINIYGHNRYNGAETLTIKNINFVANETMDFIWSHNTQSGGDVRYAHNVTIEDCSFEGNDKEVMGLRISQAYNITMKNCNASNMYGVVWATSCNGNSDKTMLTLDGVNAEGGRNGISVGTSNAVINNCDIKAEVYGIRTDGNGAFKVTATNNAIEAKQPIIVRKLTSAGYTLELNNNTLTATGTDSYQVILTTKSDDETYVSPSAAYTLICDQEYNMFKQSALK